MNKGLSFLFLLVFTLLACNKVPDLEKRLAQMIEAHNRHDVVGELAFYADDVTFSMPGEKPIRGRATLRDLFEADSIGNSEILFKDMVIRGDTVIVNSITERSDWLRLRGVAELHYAPGNRMIFQKGLIHAVELAPYEEEDVRAYENGWSDLMRWLSVAHPELVKEAQSGWLARYDANAHQTWMRLLAEWQASKSSPKK